MRRVAWRSIGLGLCALLLTAGPGAAQSQEKPPGSWEYDLTPLYLWGVSVSGSTTVKSPPASPTVPLDVEFKDALSNLSGIFTVHFEARKARWGYYGDFSYVRLTPESELPTGQTIDVDLRNPLIEAAGTFRLGSATSSPWWLVAGLRYMKLDMEAEGIPSPPLPFSSVGVSKDITDVFGGIRYRGRIGERWTVFAQGDLGAGSSDLTWAATLYTTFRISKRTSLLGGWRWLDYDYSDSSVAMDMLMNGPLLALSVHW